jgi:hypothetical protein
MSSSPRSDLLDLEDGLVVTAEDVRALRRLREPVLRSLLDRPESFAPAWPAPPEISIRRTAEGRRPFEL